MHLRVAVSKKAVLVFPYSSIPSNSRNSWYFGFHFHFQKREQLLGGRSKSTPHLPLLSV
jgi:hypothetical protein